MPGREALEQRLGYAFREPGLLEQALTHASARQPDQPSNQRLEFLGDAVLGLVVGHFLYAAYPELEEGPLTRVRAAAVSAPALARLARGLALDEELLLGRGLDRRRLPDSVLADAVEAVVGAIYLDGGLEAVRPLVLSGLGEAIEAELDRANGRNWKSILQELTQRRDGSTPGYELLEAEGPDHRKEFLVAVRVGGRELGRGRGPSKKAAEQAAARQALRALEAEASPG